MCHDRKDSPRQNPAGSDFASLCPSPSPGRDASDATGAMQQISENPALKSKLLQGMQVPLEECIPEDEVVW